MHFQATATNWQGCGELGSREMIEGVWGREREGRGMSGKKGGGSWWQYPLFKPIPFVPYASCIAGAGPRRPIYHQKAYGKVREKCFSCPVPGWHDLY